jgi:hypothetical protein
MTMQPENLGKMFRGAVPPDEEEPFSIPALQLKKKGDDNRERPTRPQGVKNNREGDGATRPVNERSKTKTKPPKKQAVKPVTRAFYIPTDVNEWLRAASKEQGNTRLALLINAFDSVPFDELAGHFKPEHGPASAGGIPRGPLPSKRRRVQQGVQICLRLTDEQNEWVALKSAEVGAPSKSAFITAILEQYRRILQDEEN